APSTGTVMRRTTTVGSLGSTAAPAGGSVAPAAMRARQLPPTASRRSTVIQELVTNGVSGVYETRFPRHRHHAAAPSTGCITFFRYAPDCPFRPVCRRRRPGGARPIRLREGQEARPGGRDEAEGHGAVRQPPDHAPEEGP